MEVLRVRGLKTYFNTPYGQVKAVDDVSFSLWRGETLGILGESGAGKSVTALTVMGMAGSLGADVISGEVWFAGKNLFSNTGLYPQIRGKLISLIPQEAGGALNPVLTVGRQLEEMLLAHSGVSARQARQTIANLLQAVELPDTELIVRLYPYQLSGGILQRVLLAMALCCGPEIIIADEPASSLDVTIQDQILALIGKTKKSRNLSMILIAHDLGVISQNTEQVLIMYGGRVMEAGPTAQVLTRPFHPYTQALLDIYRLLDTGMGEGDLTRIPVQNTFKNLPGCVFAHRCPETADRCRVDRPMPVSAGDDRVVACHYVKCMQAP